MKSQHAHCKFISLCQAKMADEKKSGGTCFTQAGSIVLFYALMVSILNVFIRLIFFFILLKLILSMLFSLSRAPNTPLIINKLGSMCVANKCASTVTYSVNTQAKLHSVDAQG